MRAANGEFHGSQTVGANTVATSAAGGIALTNGTNTIVHTLAGWLGSATTFGVYEVSQRAANAQ